MPESIEGGVVDFSAKKLEVEAARSERERKAKAAAELSKAAADPFGSLVRTHLDAGEEAFSRGMDRERIRCALAAALAKELADAEDSVVEDKFAEILADFEEALRKARGLPGRLR